MIIDQMLFLMTPDLLASAKLSPLVLAGVLFVQTLFKSRRRAPISLAAALSQSEG